MNSDSDEHNSMRPSVDSTDLSEQSPLIAAERNSTSNTNNDVEDRPLGESLTLTDSIVESKSSFYLFMLTLCIGGLQIVWSVELSYGSPFLLSLGMSKSFMAIVWIAGPLSGVLVQPYVGIRSDNCRISWGKRKPFMISGAMATILSLLCLAWSNEIVSSFTGIFRDGPPGSGTKGAIIAFATVFMWILDFSINTVQAGIRAFIVDNAPAHQQETANAWASRITGMGNVMGYIFGYVELPRHFPFFGDTQFKVLCVFASISLASTLLGSCLFVKERDPREEGPPKKDNPGVLSFFRQVFASIKRMPAPIRKVCEIQFFHWIGWFPFLFYITTYIGQLYVNPFLTPDLSNVEVEALWAKATRVGTLALLVYAIVSFASNVFLPFFVVPTYTPTIPDEAHQTLRSNSPIGVRPPHRRSRSFGDLPRTNSSASISMYLPTENSNYNPPTQQPNIVARMLSRLQIPGLTLRRTWLLAQLLFAACMFSTFFITTSLAATIMTAIVGISWSLTLWAPFALISAEISRGDEARRQKRRRNPNPENEDPELEKEDEVDQAGVILGLHNVAVSSPQILATMISSIVFQILQKPRNVPGDASVGWTLRIGGVAALISAAITSRMKESVVEDEEG